MSCGGKCSGSCGSAAKADGASLSDRFVPLGTATGESLSADHVIALAGNPNTGKSTVFNALTGLKQHTGNWPGKTVAKAEGFFRYQNERYRLVDLPGTYSLLSASVDEEIARDFLLFAQPHCTIVVVDATCLERNLNLAMQVAEVTPKLVLCVNLMDEAKRKGIVVDLEKLSQELGIPTVATAARRGEGLDHLMQAVSDVIHGRVNPEPRLPPTPVNLEQAMQRLLPKVRQVIGDLPSARWIAYRLLSGDARIRLALQTGELAKAAQYPSF